MTWSKHLKKWLFTKRAFIKVDSSQVGYNDNKIFSSLFSAWNNAVIGLMIFSASFGFVATILAVCGVCTSPLPKKIYYFHSSGEIFFVCGKL